MKIKNIVLLTIIIVILFALFLVWYCHTNVPNLEVLSDGNGIQDFYIENDKVYIIGGITVRNNTDHVIKYTLTGISKEDYDNGLLKSPYLSVFNEDGTANSFIIYANDTNTYNVMLVGEFAGNEVKYNRLMPQILIN